MLLTCFPVGEWLLYPLETKFKTNPDLPKQIDGVIVLSGGEEAVLARIWNQIEFDRAVERDIYFLKLMREYPNATFVFSGGGGAESKKYSRTLLLQFAKIFGLDENKIQFELESTTTMESVKNLHGLIKPKSTQMWVVITSAWHMPRAKLLFDHYGWEIIPFPVDHLSHKHELYRFEINFSDHLELFKIAVKEWIGIIVYQSGLL